MKPWTESIEKRIKELTEKRNKETLSSQEAVLLMSLQEELAEYMDNIPVSPLTNPSK